jgi:signal transduction histidine kinase
MRTSIDSGGWECTVCDQGHGIPEGLEGRLFEEGFTTRTGPLHTGMGLPVARHLVGQAGGTVQLGNVSGGSGCVATIRLPLEPPT